MTSVFDQVNENKSRSNQEIGRKGGDIGMEIVIFP